MPSWRSASSRATASPTIPAPTTATSHSRGGCGRSCTACETSIAWPCPLKPPIQPQLALSRKQLPEDEGWAYEPKYDGFRALAFVDGDELFLQSRNGRPLARYFPELEFPEGRYVIDGELVILDDDGREVFDALQNRLHPAESRVEDAGGEDAGAAFAPSTCSRSATSRRSTTRSPSAARRSRS